MCDNETMELGLSNSTHGSSKGHFDEPNLGRDIFDERCKGCKDQGTGHGAGSRPRANDQMIK